MSKLEEARKMLAKDKEFSEWIKFGFENEGPKDGKLDAKGVFSLMSKLDLNGKNPTEKEIEDFFKSLGKDKVTFEEFYPYSKKACQKALE